MPGEFPTKNSAKTARAIVETLQGAGYAGAMPWAVLSDDTATDFDAAESGLADWARAHAAELAP